jgi:hypothetical protein
VVVGERGAAKRKRKEGRWSERGVAGVRRRMSENEERGKNSWKVGAKEKEICGECI